LGERLHKVLAAAGVASRRQIESWIRAGRVSVNGAPAALGVTVTARDRITIDGRRVHLKSAPAPELLMYHRSPGEALKPATAAEGDLARSTEERLPAVAGRRWLPLSPLAPLDGGLELFSTDGAVRAAAGRAAHRLPSAYSVRVRGPLDDALIEQLAPAALALEPPVRVITAGRAGGEGQNLWLALTVEGARGRDLRALFASLGVVVSRVLRVGFGPVALDPHLARGRSRRLEPAEAEALREALGIIPPAKPKKRRSQRAFRPGSRSARR
jgi:23S rRNA pseudouridine2605 synthase